MSKLNRGSFPKKELWAALFEEEKLSHKMVEIENTSEGVTFNLPLYGELQVSAQRAAPIGANFMSDVYFVTVSSQNGEEQKAFIKVLVLNPASKTAAFIGKWYDRETCIYRDWIPMLQEIRSHHGLGPVDIPISIPQCYFVNLVETEDGEGYHADTVVVIEELKSKGFLMMDPTACHSLDHIQLAMKAYANFHALSIAGLRKWKASNSAPSPLLDVFNKSPYYVAPPIVYGSMVLPNYSRVLRHFGHEEAAAWLDSLIPKLESIWSWDDFIQAGPLTCVIHGDSWNNNQLFRYSTEDPEKPVEMTMVDWQIARCGHPAIDLCYYIFCSTSSDFRKQHLDHLLSLYFRTLKTNLAKLSIDLDLEGFTEERFLLEARQRFVLGMLMAFFILPIILDAAKASKHAHDIKEKINDGPSDDEPDAFEDTQKKSWDALFQPDTVVANAVLSKRLVELILDVKEVAIKLDC